MPFELSAEPVALREQILALDAACQHLPVMTLLQGSITLRQLATHLRSLLLIEADGLPYLLRFADSQMLVAANSVFSAEQRASVPRKLDVWWTIDHNDVLNNAADPVLCPPGAPAPPPLCLDERQTHSLLTAVAVPLLAGQLRHLKMSFAHTLSHAEEMRFVDECIVAAREAAINDDAKLTSLALTRWRERRYAVSAS